MLRPGRSPVSRLFTIFTLCCRRPYAGPTRGAIKLSRMNIFVMPKTLSRANPVAPNARKTRFNPRADVLDEVIAGFLWMHLDLPDRVSRTEIQDFAHRLVAQIKAGSDQRDVEREIVNLQHCQFCRPVDPAIIRALARRSRAAVTGL
jgi:hypothetical protein